MIIEIIRIIFTSLIGAGFVFLLQPYLYGSGIIPLGDVDDPAAWVSDKYTIGAAIVFSTCLVCTLLWYILTYKAKVRPGRDARSFWRLMWWIFLLFPILSICVALYFFNTSNNALLSLTGFYVLDTFISFWLPTAWNTHGELMFVAPGSASLRQLFGGK